MSYVYYNTMITEKFPYNEIKRKRVEGKRLYDTESGFLPSVTTILSATKPRESVEALNNWRKRVGTTEAARITTEAGNVGTAMHCFLEEWVLTDTYDVPGTGLLYTTADRMAKTVIENIKDDLNEVWGTEVNLYYPGLYAGTTDLTGVWKDNQAIFDFKQTNKPKKREWVSDYFMQIAAYGMAHNALFDTNIQEGHIFMCSRDCQFQHFAISGDEWNHWTMEWAKRVDQYYTLHT